MDLFILNILAIKQYAYTYLLPSQRERMSTGVIRSTFDRKKIDGRSDKKDLSKNKKSKRSIRSNAKSDLLDFLVFRWDCSLHIKDRCDQRSNRSILLINWTPLVYILLYHLQKTNLVTIYPIKNNKYLHYLLQSL